jgi:hypothetical protein
MIELFWVEDFLSGEVLEHHYYSTREEATTRRNELGYGIVKSFKFQDGGKLTLRGGEDPLVAFRAVPGEKVEIA